MHKKLKLGALALFVTLATGAAHAASLVASYSFNDTLAADQATLPALVSIDPLGQNGFETAIVKGQSQRVFRWSGDGLRSQDNAGLKLDTTGLVNYSSYSVALTFEFASQAVHGGGWRRVIDTQNRQSDNGFYVNPNNLLELVQVNSLPAGPTTFTTPGFHDVVMTVSPTLGGRQLVHTYLDGTLQASATMDVMGLDHPDNPGHLLHFFVDNVAADAQQEFANGRIASLQLYDGVIVPSPVPEPSQVVMMLVGALGVLIGVRHRRAA